MMFLDHYVNDDLFPKHDEEEQHTSATSVHVKDSNGDGDYYVNDDLFPTAAQAAHMCTVAILTND